MNCCDYAKRGNSCDTNNTELTSNQKFIPQNYSAYNLAYTQMYQYPAETHDFMKTIGKVEDSIDIKVRKPANVIVRHNEPYKSGCCGKK